MSCSGLCDDHDQNGSVSAECTRVHTIPLVSLDPGTVTSALDLPEQIISSDTSVRESREGSSPQISIPVGFFYLFHVFLSIALGVLLNVNITWWPELLLIVPAIPFMLLFTPLADLWSSCKTVIVAMIEIDEETYKNDLQAAENGGNVSEISEENYSRSNESAQPAFLAANESHSDIMGDTSQVNAARRSHLAVGQHFQSYDPAALHLALQGHGDQDNADGERSFYTRPDGIRLNEAHCTKRHI